MLNKFKGYIASLVAVAKAHPVLFTLTLVLVPFFLTGIAWKVISLVRRVPVVGNAAANAATAAAKATGSA